MILFTKHMKNERTNFFKSRQFGILAVSVGFAGLFCVSLLIATFDKYLINEFSYNISGWNYLAYFTEITNLSIDFWLLGLGFSILFKKERLYRRLTSPALRGALAVYIFVVGFIYWAVLFPFVGFYSWGLWWGNLTDVWNHLFIPVFTVFLFFKMPAETRIEKKRLWLWLVYPLVYLAFCFVRGAIDGWYPYPFLDPASEVLKSKNMDPALVLPFAVVFLLAMFVGLFFAATKLHNKRADKHIGNAEEQKSESDNIA